LNGSLNPNPNNNETYDQDSRRRQPPPVTANPTRFNNNTDNQIPLAPGVKNLPLAWQDLPQNFQTQLRRLLPIYYDITGPSRNLVNQDPYVPPNLFEDGEPNPNVKDFLDDRSEYIDSKQFEPPNKSKLNFLNFLLFLFNLIFSLKANEIKGDIYEVVIFVTIPDTENPEQKKWQATVREKNRTVQSEFGPIKLGGRTIGTFAVADQFPLQGSEVTVQSIVLDEQTQEPIKIILSNSEEILKIVPPQE
jgi:hypothetical protein